ncbi:glycoside hydrolase family 9 protein [Glycomyces paridis]|uniref:glycoside hydrolase family 9 protein n=1 Tax=Glycomyces paridis TaxID=2126555 RepID=UPI00195B44CD|nr:glycoside hydrolase family 9 protein [Glycomyces paridis]
MTTAYAQDEPTNLIINGDFASGTDPWWHTENLIGAVADGEWCLDVPGGTANAWDAIIGQNDLPLTAGESYELRFTARASTPLSVRALVQRDVDPWPSAIEEFPVLDTEPQVYSYTFTANEDWSDAQLAFQIGRHAEPWQFCISDVAVLSDAEPPVYEPDTGPRVRVNQVGYLPEGPKRATLVSDATESVAWALQDAAGAEVASGVTDPHGTEPTSDLAVHTIDLSDVTATGEGFTLTADGEVSYPFAIGAGAYDSLAIDALSFYYPQRSGIAIDDEIAPGYGREAGHVGAAPNQGDVDVPCYPGTCDYSLDVSGGWYDAGDHGKYVVNGGISVAQVMGTYERALHADGGDADRLGDGSLRIPEHGDGVPDVLDEARWEMEFLLSMQVPAGEQLAGMAHHKMSDEAWTGLPLLPADDPQPRYLGPPSTAATLNLAAAAAQCARLFSPYDEAFAAECRTAAETAWDAATANPDMLAQENVPAGSGGYGDAELDDEFYWAAAELFLTTGESAYEDFILGSQLHTDDVFDANGFGWQSVAPLARLQLAAVPNSLADRERVIDSVVAAGEDYLARQAASPWDLAYGQSGQFDWGSNSNVLNAMIVTAVAYDLSGDERFRDGVYAGLDYILGRNALNNSYVTGYGTHDSRNMHSRWYANQLDPTLPNPPVGTISGGPNSVSSTWDPVAQRWLQDCTGQGCYIDDIGSFATNELTVNWNAPLSWIANFVADTTEGSDPQPDDLAAVENLAATPTTETVKLTWDTPPWTNEIEVRRDSTVIAVLPGGSTEYTDTDLEPNTEYVYTVTGVPEGDEGALGSSVSVTTGFPPDEGACQATVSVVNDWGSGWQGAVQVRNYGESSINGWDVGWTWTEDQRITQLWNAEWEQTGADVTTSPLGWNAAIASGGSVEFGFIATGPAEPQDFISCEFAD